MSVEIIKFRDAHLRALMKEPMNKHMAEWSYLESMIKDMIAGDAFTLLYDNQVMVCGGITKYWQGRGQIWTVFSEMSKLHFTPIYRGIRKWLEEMIKTKYRRIELCVNCDLDVAKRRAELLGFEIECERARKFLPDGEDCALYSMVRD